MIFPSVKVDSIVQVNDLFRIDLTGSMVHDGSEFDKIEVTPVTGGDSYTVLDKATELKIFFLDWMFDTEGSKDILVKFTQGTDSKEVTKTITVKTEAQDKLFSNDEMLNGLEPNVWGLLPAGRSSFKFTHRIAQEEIIRQLVELGYDVTPAKILNIKEVSWWSRYLAMELIFESNITFGSDVHTGKRDTYRTKTESAKARVIITLDENEDGKADGEIKTFPKILVRR